MTFQIHALPAEDFAPLFTLSDDDLRARRARRLTIAECPGSPCRVTLEDAKVGETVILINHTHLDADTPYHGSHAIFVREGQPKAHPRPGEIPEALLSRTMSLRTFDKHGMMRDGVALPGPEIPETLDHLLSDLETSEVHIHFAGPGCFAARATRVWD